jgi:alkyl sulfatase BDS1-like metallo-beta-lactamase superfamily hydrolase
MIKAGVCILLVAALLFGAFLPVTAAGRKEADPKTREMNSRLPQTLSADDREESEFSIRGLIASEPLVDIHSNEGKPVWDTKRYGFLEAESPNPDTVPPALWRHARRNAVHGLFKVTDGIYQVRGYDISNHYCPE